ncbi:unnamed protein product [Hydatigera taeniaeformis]|uniref:G_PROTEIN_RECEP_F1_2 domain-containing protein n=1 Tax=Hydatigena taeniaeformis TaxID=6205 RepID=A0A0R3X4Z5_HYDTA|nr:unnamed protein product [Hydatigera taeniaeformis]
MNSTAPSPLLSKLRQCLDFQLWSKGPNFRRVLIIYQTTLVTYLGLPVSLIGIATSVVSLVLFSRDNLTPQTTRRLLLTMSVADAVFLLSSLLYLQTMNLCGGGCRRISYLLPVSTLVNIFEMLRNWTVVLVCIERYIITCHPLQSKQWLSLSRTDTSIALCVIATVIARIPFMAYVTLESYGITFASTVHLLKQIHSTIDAFIMTVLPLLIIVICSLRISRCIQDSELLHQAKRLKYRSNSFKVTRVLLVVIIVFSILMLPLVPVNVLAFEWFFPGATCPVLIGRQVVDPLAVFGSLLHSMANFLIYVIYWQKYRRVLLTMCRGRSLNQHFRRSSTFCSNDGLLPRLFTTNSGNLSVSQVHRSAQNPFEGVEGREVKAEGTQLT